MRILKNSYTIPEIFFVQRLEEQIHSKTIDTNRNRIHNPKTILNELKSVIKGIQNGKIKNEDHIKHVANEASILINNDCGLTFSKIPLAHFLKLLQTPKRENWNDIIHCINLYLNQNKDYRETILSNLEKELHEVNQNYLKHIAGEKDENGQIIGWNVLRIDKWTNYLVTEIIFIGFSKSRIRQLCYKHLIGSKKTFDLSFSDFKRLICATKNETNVLIKVKIPSPIVDTICESYPNISVVTEEDFDIKAIKDFIISRPSYNFTLNIKIESLDFQKAAYEAKSIIASILDFINLGHKNSKSEYFHHFKVLNAQKKHGGIDSNYYLDGLYRSDESLHKILNEKFQKIVSNKSIDKNVVKILKSGVRYLRLGDEDTEAEQKLLNYWIGIEHIFSSPNDEVKLINKIAKQFSQIHLLSYFKRNVENLHQTIKRLKLNVKIEGFDETSLDYLIDEKIINNLITISLPDYPLMAYRGKKFLDLIKNKNDFQKSLTKHENDLICNIFRIYRIRNEIVHNAAIKGNITELTSHLQYYLLYMLSSMLDFFTKDVIDINKDKKISIEDYFITYRLKYESLEKKALCAEQMLKYDNPLGVHLEINQLEDVESID